MSVYPLTIPLPYCEIGANKSNPLLCKFVLMFLYFNIKKISNYDNFLNKNLCREKYKGAN